MVFLVRFPPYASLEEILDMAKSACDNTTPLELIRIKISVTLSISKSAFKLITPNLLS
ncbi:Uncharacterised protein [Bacteroides xylanisolvens]|nr:Uncharacterised protein [Bacteroides xylanisolvens]